MCRYFLFLCLALTSINCQQSSGPKIVSKTTIIAEDTLDNEKKVTNQAHKFEGWEEIIDSAYINLDIRYASDNNFTKKIIYDCPKCYLRPEVAKALRACAKFINEKYNYKVILYDCYRPRPYQQKLWDIVPDPKFVSDPKKGSMHNRGMAIDIGLLDQNDNLLDMGSDFDHFGPKSYFNDPSISKQAKANRQILREALELYGFEGITSEWWHYSYRKNIKAFSDWLWPCE